MIPKAIDELTFDAIVALVAEGLRESRTIDFKRDPAGTDDKAKKEFLADVSSLANTAGGDLVFGVEEAQGEAVAVPGIALEDPDKEVLRLESILRSGLEPRLPKVDVRWLPGPGGRGVLIVRTPRSYLGPHRVSYQDHAKFYARTSAGKAAMDVGELRAAFSSAEGLHQSIRRFRNERLGIIEAGEGPVALRSGAKAVLHVVPLEAFTAPRAIAINNHDHLPPFGIWASGWNGRHTLEGYATYSGLSSSTDESFGYTLLFRSGIIEGVVTVGFTENGKIFIPVEAVEKPIISRLQQYRRKLLDLGVSSPVYVFFSLLQSRGYYLGTSAHFLREPYLLRSDALLLPEIEITDAQQPTEHAVKPILDQLWNAFGFESCYHYNDAGQYVGGR